MLVKKAVRMFAHKMFTMFKNLPFAVFLSFIGISQCDLCSYSFINAMTARKDIWNPAFMIASGDNNKMIIAVIDKKRIEKGLLSRRIAIRKNKIIINALCVGSLAPLKNR